MGYENGKIYKLTSPHTDKVYIGSTKQSLNERLCKHVSQYKAFQQGQQSYISSIKLIELGDYNIELIENFPCDGKDELLSREGYHMRQYGERCVNRCQAGRTKEMYREENKPKIQEYMKVYQQVNKDKLQEYKKNYFQKNKDIITTKHKAYYSSNAEQVKAKVKEYRVSNQDVIKQRKKLYYEQNKERILQERSKQHRCICGSTYLQSTRLRHTRSQRHQRFENTLKYIQQHDPAFYEIIITDHSLDC